MMRMLAAALLPLLLVAGCNEQDAAIAPAPVALSEEAVGHYCQMIVLEHPGPKAQVHLAGNPAPLFFTQVRDALAYRRLPEQDADVVAIYVSDMGAEGATWDDPGSNNWIRVEDAIFVQGSKRRGGMGAPEFIPFADRTAALRFAAVHGGTTIPHGDLTDAMVLAPVEVELGTESAGDHSGDDLGGDDQGGDNQGGEAHGSDPHADHKHGGAS